MSRLERLEPKITEQGRRHLPAALAACRRHDTLGVIGFRTHDDCKPPEEES